MKIYAGSSRKPFDFSTITKYVGKDVWVAIESRFWGPDTYMMYIRFYDVDDRSVTYNGIDTPTLEGLESGYQDKDFYQKLQARFNGESPTKTSKAAFSKAFTKIHKPVELLTTEEFQDLLTRCEVEE